MSRSGASSGAKKGFFKSKAWKWLLILAALVGLAALAWHFLVTPERVRAAIAWIDSWGIWAVVAYAVIYVVLATLTFPSTPLNIAGGILFSYWTALAVALACGTLSAILNFLFARFVAEDWIRRRLKKVSNADTLLETVEDEPFKIIFLTRLNPFIPASVKNFGFALARIPLRTYVIATILGQIPIFMIHVYLGWAGGLAMMQGEERPSTVRWLMIGGGVLISLALFVVMTVYVQRHLRSRTGGKRRRKADE